MRLHLLLLLFSLLFIIQSQQNRQVMIEKNTKSRQELATRINSNVQGKLGHKFGTQEGFELVQATPLSGNNRESQRDRGYDREDRVEETNERIDQIQRGKVEEERRQTVENKDNRYQNNNVKIRVETTEDPVILKQIQKVPTIQMKSQIIQPQIVPKNTPQIQTYSSSVSNAVTPSLIISSPSPSPSQSIPLPLPSSKSLPPPPPPKTNLVRGAQNSIIGQQNMLDGNQNKIRGNLNIATGNKNAIHGSHNDVLANNALIHGSQNVVIQCLDEDQLY